MRFEFDPAKSASNKRKHGVDFEEAQELWKDGKALEFAVMSQGEQRFMVVGMLSEKHWTAIITYRSDAIRLISIRRSRRSEIAAYEG